MNIDYAFAGQSVTIAIVLLVLGYGGVVWYVVAAGRRDAERRRRQQLKERFHSVLGAGRSVRLTPTSYDHSEVRRAERRG